MTNDSHNKIAYGMNGDILEIQVSGDAATTDSRTLAGKIIDILSNEQPRSVLLDVRAFKGRFGLLDIYYLSYLQQTRALTDYAF